MGQKLNFICVPDQINVDEMYGNRRINKVEA